MKKYFRELSPLIMLAVLVGGPLFPVVLAYHAICEAFDFYAQEAK